MSTQHNDPLWDILSRVPGDDPVTVIVVREPDAPNEIHVYGVDQPVVVDIDCGSADLTDRNEFLEWASSVYDDVDRLSKNDPALWHVYGIVQGYGDMHGLHSHDAIKAAFAEG